MKMLKKLAALILAATMVLVLFTACGGDGGSTGTREPEKEKEMIATINKEKRGASTLSSGREAFGRGSFHRKQFLWRNVQGRRSCRW